MVPWLPAPRSAHPTCWFFATHCPDLLSLQSCERGRTYNKVLFWLMHLSLIKSSIWCIDIAVFWWLPFQFDKTILLTINYENIYDIYDSLLATGICIIHGITLPPVLGCCYNETNVKTQILSTANSSGLQKKPSMRTANPRITSGWGYPPLWICQHHQDVVQGCCFGTVLLWSYYVLAYMVKDTSGYRLMVSTPLLGKMRDVFFYHQPIMVDNHSYAQSTIIMIIANHG